MDISYKFESARKFLQRIVPDKIPVFVMDEKGNDILVHTDIEFDGYEKRNGLYVNTLKFPEHDSELNLNMRRVIYKFPKGGFFVKYSEDYEEPEFDSIEKNILLSYRNERCDKICIIITNKFGMKLFKHDEYQQLTYKHTELIDSSIVHEVLHAEHSKGLRKRLNNKLHEKKLTKKPSLIDRYIRGFYVVPNNELSELTSSIGEIFYIIEKKYIKQIEKRENDFNESIQRMDPVYGKAAELYFKIKDDPELWSFAKNLFSGKDLF